MSKTTISKDTTLTPKQEKYVRNLIDGMSQRQAYMDAYPKAKKWKESAIDSQASILMSNSKVAKRYRELLDKASDKAIMSSIERKKWLTDLIIKGTIVTDGVDVPVNSSDRLKALDILNKMNGEYITKVETTDDGFNINVSIGYEKES